MSLTYPKTKNRAGTTLIEIMVGLLVLTVGVMGFMGAFGAISKSVLFSKSRTIANNLAQEKIEYLKNLSYYRLLATTSTLTSSVELGSFKYDSGYYPQESITVGEINFIRRVLIQKVSETSGLLEERFWYEQDTGLKLITSYVVWEEGQGWKKTVVTNLRDNINRQTLDSTISGSVVSGVTPIENATIVIQQNVGLKDQSDVTGAFSIDVASGTYDIRASAEGYFSAIISTSATTGNTTSITFDLVEKDSGTVTGVAYMNTHLLISEICGSVNGDDNLEYVELYNPTAVDFVIDTGANDPSYSIEFVDTLSGASTVLNTLSETIYVNLSIPSSGYYLIASSHIVNGVLADAYYSNAGLTINVPDNRIPLGISGGVAIVSRGVYEVDGSTVDAFGWGLAGGSPYGPADAREGDGYRNNLGAGGDGLATDEVFERLAFSSSTEADMDVFPVPGIHMLEGNGHDTDENEADWIIHTHTDNDFPQNTSVTEKAKSGMPANSALVFVDDGLSAAVEADGPSPSSYFQVFNVATGTWYVLVSSNGYVYEASGINVVANTATDIGNIIISSPASGGFISGRVVDDGGSPLENIEVVASGGSGTSDSLGYFRMQIDEGTYTVVANSGNLDPNYTTAEATGVVVTAGQQTTLTGNLVLYEGGAFTGFVTTNGTDPLPGIPIIATNGSSVEMGSFVTDTFGNFVFSNLPDDTYTFTPQLEVGESASPVTLSGTVSQGDTVHVGTFTVSNAFGTVEGTVTSSGEAIATGVLIVAVPDPVTIGTNPPTLNQTLRDGSTYYYFGSSGTDGTYSVSLRGGLTYNVYGWFTTFSGGTPTTTKKSGSVLIPVGGSGTVNMSW